MPIYEYVCEKCGERLEVTQKMTDAPLKRHNGASKCGGRLKKLMSHNSFHLKGSGWYKTDYASPGKAEKKPPDKAGKTEKTSKKTDTDAKSTPEKAKPADKSGS